MTSASCGGATIVRRVRRTLLPMLFLVLTLASCGGGGGDREDAENLVDTSFSEEIASADLKFEGELQLEGSLAFDRPLRLQASGPFRTNDGKLPSMDLEIKVGTDGGGQTVTTGYLSTGDRAFLKFQDVYYEQPATAVRRANRSIARRNRGPGSFRELGLNPRAWLEGAEDEGEEEVAGVATRHLSGALEVEALLLDINRFIRRSGAAIHGATGERPPEPLSRQDIREIVEVVEDPTFDVYVGKADDIVRRISGRIEFDVPQERLDDFDGIEGGHIQFSVELARVNGDQEIEAPARARRMSSLTRSLGSGGLFGALGGGGDAPSDAEPSEPPSGPDDGTTPETQNFRDYAECLDEARPGDTEALQRCADLLERP
jgi:hypothetical protein